MRRTIALLAAAAGLILTACSCGGEAGAPPASSPVSKTSQVEEISQETLIECENVERAYNAWEWKPTSSLDWTAVNVERRQEDGETFLAAADGYTDQPALALAVAIAEYNLQLSLVSASYVTEGSADTADAEAALDKVRSAYGRFRDETCS